jgi:cellulose synthase/poly-beta-1,6-N-acetylglucosamine synthase-like glycosyltransferase
MTLKVIFWILAAILFYAYAGYAVILFILVRFKRLFYHQKSEKNREFEPDVCLFVTAYNEKDYIDKKIENTFKLDYPGDKIQYIWITDGSDDGTPDLLRRYENIEVYHLPERRGKMHAMNRGMEFVKKPFVVFSDTNTFLNKNAIREIVAKFRNPETGCVAGEKRIIGNVAEDAASAGEGLYWKYESWIKKMDSELGSAVGAVGELFAIRSELFERVEEDTILDDFIISLRIAQKGYKIAYASSAYAEEAASLNIHEELKRKIRIAAGGVQALIRLKNLLNPFRYGLLTWQYFSHKVLRWTFAPLSLFLLPLVNTILVVGQDSPGFFNIYILFLFLQIVLYLLAIVGMVLENKRLKFKGLFLPYYFVLINIASVRGILRYLLGKQPAWWEKSERARE